MAGPESTAPVMMATVWPIMFIAGIFLGLRLFVKFHGSSRLLSEDYILIFSWLCLLVQVSLVQAALSMGFGMHIDDIIATEPQNTFYITMYGQIALSITILSINFSKISFAVTLLRLTKGWWKYFVWFAIWTLLLLMVPAILFPWIQCTPVAKAFDNSIPGHCFSKSIAINYGIFEAAWAAAMDFAFALIPWKVIWGLQLIRAERIGVGVAMSLGFLAGIIAIIKAIYIVQLAEEDFSFSGKDVTIWCVAEPASAIIAASIPVLRVFINAKVSSQRFYSSKETGIRTDAANHIQLANLSNTLKSAPGYQTSERRYARWETSGAEYGSEKSTLHEKNLHVSGIARTGTFLIESPEEMDGSCVQLVSQDLNRHI